MDFEKKNKRKNFQTTFIQGFLNFSQFSNFAWDNDGVGVEGASDVNGENVGKKTERGYCQHLYEDRKNLKRIVMSSICSQTHPLLGGTQNLGQPRKHFF